jgi:hypothetical protein
VHRVVGAPELIAAYIDPHPDLCTNWGYPSVYKCTPPATKPSAVWCMMYETQTFPHHQVFMLVAQSDDGIAWSPRDTTHELPTLQGRRYSNQIMPVGNTTRNPEFGSVVTGHDGKLRVFGEFSIWISDDGIRWSDTHLPWQPHPTDYPVSAFFNNVTQQWQMLARPRGSDRRIASHNLPPDLSGYSNTSLPQLALDTDGEDSPLAEFYGMLAVPYSGYFIGM